MARAVVAGLFGLCVMTATRGAASPHCPNPEGDTMAIPPAARHAATRATRHFIFGYGSLICPASRAVTAPSLAGSPSTPCAVRGLERGWNARIRVRLPRGGGGDDIGDGSGPASAAVPRHLDGWTAVGVRAAEGGLTSGVLIEVDEEELARFDVREGGYDRRSIRLEDVERVPGHRGDGGEADHVVFRRGDRVRRTGSPGSDDGDGGGDSDAGDAAAVARDDGGEDNIRVWVYVQRDHTPASSSFPIKQSYVDVILRGCLSVSEAFARSFLETTHGWWHDGRIDGSSGGGEEKMPEEDDHHTWVEDRHFPLYVRSDPEYSKRMGPALDDLLREHQPEALERRRRYPARGDAGTRR